jgi:tRNA threonylcarbamoyladenosine biosynthesis protein TsaB
LLLAIDTSTAQAGLALYDGAVVAELNWVAGRRHSAQLLPQLERLLALVDVQVERLSALAVARGPGSFTGLRVGLATAQGLSVARGIPAYGLCTLDVLAAGQGTTQLPIWPLLDAGRGRFATARYQRRDGRLEREGEIKNLAFQEVLARLEPPCLVCGNLDPEQLSRISESGAGQIELASPARGMRRAAVLAELGWQRHLAGDPDWRSGLEPLYAPR